jgi:two-component system, OmpR family, response regulator
MRILLIEDDTRIENLFLEVLQRAGHSVDHLPRAEPAEAVVGVTHYDLAIVDIGLPGMDGLSPSRDTCCLSPWVTPHIAVRS